MYFDNDTLLAILSNSPLPIFPSIANMSPSNTISQSGVSLIQLNRYIADTLISVLAPWHQSSYKSSQTSIAHLLYRPMSLHDLILAVCPLPAQKMLEVYLSLGNTNISNSSSRVDSSDSWDRLSQWLCQACCCLCVYGYRLFKWINV